MSEFPATEVTDSDEAHGRYTLIRRKSTPPTAPPPVLDTDSVGLPQILAPVEDPSADLVEAMDALADPAEPEPKEPTLDVVAANITSVAAVDTADVRMPVSEDVEMNGAVSDAFSDDIDVSVDPEIADSTNDMKALPSFEEALGSEVDQLASEEATEIGASMEDSDLADADPTSAPMEPLKKLSSVQEFEPEHTDASIGGEMDMVRRLLVGPIVQDSKAQMRAFESRVHELEQRMQARIESLEHAMQMQQEQAMEALAKRLTESNEQVQTVVSEWQGAWADRFSSHEEKTNEMFAGQHQQLTEMSNKVVEFASVDPRSLQADVEALSDSMLDVQDRVKALRTRLNDEVEPKIKDVSRSLLEVVDGFAADLAARLGD